MSYRPILAIAACRLLRCTLLILQGYHPMPGPGGMRPAGNLPPAPQMMAPSQMQQPFMMPQQQMQGRGPPVQASPTGPQGGLNPAQSSPAGGQLKGKLSSRCHSFTMRTLTGTKSDTENCPSAKATMSRLTLLVCQSAAITLNLHAYLLRCGTRTRSIHSDQS